MLNQTQILSKKTFTENFRMDVMRFSLKFVQLSIAQNVTKCFRSSVNQPAPTFTENLTLYGLTWSKSCQNSLHELKFRFSFHKNGDRPHAQSSPVTFPAFYRSSLKMSSQDLLAPACEVTASSTNSTADIHIVSAPLLSAERPFCEQQAAENRLYKVC